MGLMNRNETKLGMFLKVEQGNYTFSIYGFDGGAALVETVEDALKLADMLTEFAKKLRILDEADESNFQVSDP